MGIPFQNTYARLPERFFSKQQPARAPEPFLILTNPALASELGIDPAWLKSKAALAGFSGNEIPSGAEPIAQAYAGHQFGGFVPQLGDGRAILLGEVIDINGKRRDIQLKGSGRTVFSRGGDGKSALGPVLREYLVSEAMHAYGVPTTRALAAVFTGEVVEREEPAPGGVFTRVAASHIRVGTFQYFAARQDTEAIRILTDHCIARHYPDAAEAENPALAFLENVIRAQALLIAKWLPLGFIHGVMNTDNCAISGETIDYGPCAFLDTFHPDKVFSFIDRRGRYAWGNQPTIAHWNLTRLAETLLPIIDPTPERAKELASAALEKFIDHFQPAYLNHFREKLGLSNDTDLDTSAAFIKSTLGTLAQNQVDFTLFFRHLTLLAAEDTRADLPALFSDPQAAETWIGHWKTFAKQDDHLAKMKAVNPILIPRNHRIEEAIQAAYQKDFSLFHRLADALTKPFEENPEYADLERAPLPEQCVKNTFCGT
jgi:serine/tyrosine/threonine adenylyltransferase